MPLTIKVHTDTDLLNWFADDERKIDTRASLESYSDAVFEKLAAEYPDADLSVTWSHRTGGANSVEVLDEESNAVSDYAITDRVNALIGRVFESSDTWVRYAE